jgi:hypothetical protein
MLKLTGVCLGQLLQVAVLLLFLSALPETRLESVVVVVGATIWLYLWDNTEYAVAPGKREHSRENSASSYSSSRAESTIDIRGR